MLMTLKAADGLLRDFGAPLETREAVQGLHGAKGLTPAEISSLSPVRASQGRDDEASSQNDRGDDAPAEQQVGQPAGSSAQPLPRASEEAGSPAARSAQVKSEQTIGAWIQNRMSGSLRWLAHAPISARPQAQQLPQPQQLRPPSAALREGLAAAGADTGAHWLSRLACAPV